jgi:hypothetical protein
MKALILLLFITCTASISFGQMNDTIYYKSGMEKVVEISEFTAGLLKFKKVNSNGEVVNSQVRTNVVLRFVMYDEEGILQYSSKEIDETVKEIQLGSKYPTTVSVSKHQLSVNPFFLTFLSFSGKYNYRFGNKMQYSICSRATYLSPTISNAEYWGDAMIGAGFQYTPFYNNRFAFGVDFVPMIGFYTDDIDDINIMLPFSFNLDFYLNETFGLSGDFGIGSLTNDGSSVPTVRGHLGILIQFKDKKTFDTAYR